MIEVSKKLAKQSVITISAVNISKKEEKQIKDLIRSMERKRSHSGKPQLLHNLSIIRN